MSLNSILATAPLTTQNFVLKANGTTIGNSLIFDNGTSLFIGNGQSSATPQTAIIEGTDGSGTNIAGAEFRIQGGQGTGTGVGGALTFYTAPVGSTGSSLNTAVERFRIASTGAATFAGFVGVNGSPATGFPLEAYINSSTAYSSTSRGNVMRVYNINTGANIFAGIELGGAGSANDGLAGLNAVVTGSGSAALTFYTRDSNTFAERMRITSAGNVGIGTSSPSAKLEITNGRVLLNNGYSYQFYNTSSVAVDTLQMFTDGNVYLDAKDSTGGNLIFRTSNSVTERMRITSGGNVGIGTTSDNYRLEVNANAATWATRIYNSNATGSGLVVVTQNTTTSAGLALYNGSSYVLYARNDGNVGIGTTGPSYQLQLSTDSAAKPTSALWTIASDERIKENINPYNKGLEVLLKINPITYDYNGLGGFAKGKGGVGIIAQEIMDILPDSVSSIKAKLNETDEDETDILNFNGHELTYVLINAIKEQQALITSLQSQINELKNK
jgi:hypothetical protein